MVCRCWNTEHTVCTVSWFIINIKQRRWCNLYIILLEKFLLFFPLPSSCWRLSTKELKKRLASNVAGTNEFGKHESSLGSRGNEGREANPNTATCKKTYSSITILLVKLSHSAHQTKKLKSRIFHYTISKFIFALPVYRFLLEIKTLACLKVLLTYSVSLWQGIQELLGYPLGCF